MKTPIPLPNNTTQSNPQIESYVEQIAAQLASIANTTADSHLKYTVLGTDLQDTIAAQVVYVQRVTGLIAKLGEGLIAVCERQDAISFIQDDLVRKHSQLLDAVNILARQQAVIGEAVLTLSKAISPKVKIDFSSPDALKESLKND